MPDDPGPRAHPPRSALWVAPVAALGVVVVLAAALWVSSASDGSSSTAPSASVITAPTSSAATLEVGQSPPLGPELQPVTPGASCALGRARVLRVLQFNIHFGISRGGIVDLTRIASDIEAVRPDLVSLNEVDSGTLRSRRIDQPAYLAQATGLRVVYGPNLPWEGGLFGNAILTRFPVVESHNLRLPVIDGFEPRGLLTATVRVGGRKVSFSSLHLSSGTSGQADRVLEAETVAHVLRTARRPTVVAGDLNSPPTDLPVRILRQYLVDAQEQGGTGAGDTVPEEAPTSRIDYVLHDRHFATVPGSTRVLPSDSSDHRSVFTELALLPQHGC